MYAVLGLQLVVSPLAIAITGICFGLSHIPHEWHIPVALGGLGLGGGNCPGGGAAVATGNLLVPVIAHTVANLLSSSFWKLDAPD
jgi:uncharacterized protein